MRLGWERTSSKAQDRFPWTPSSTEVYIHTLHPALANLRKTAVQQLFKAYGQDWVPPQFFDILEIHQTPSMAFNVFCKTFGLDLNALRQGSTTERYYLNHLIQALEAANDCGSFLSVDDAALIEAMLKQRNVIELTQKLVAQYSYMILSRRIDEVLTAIPQWVALQLLSGSVRRDGTLSHLPNNRLDGHERLFNKYLALLYVLETLQSEIETIASERSRLDSNALIGQWNELFASFQRSDNETSALSTLKAISDLVKRHGGARERSHHSADSAPPADPIASSFNSFARKARLSTPARRFEWEQFCAATAALSLSKWNSEWDSHTTLKTGINRLRHSLVKALRNNDALSPDAISKAEALVNNAKDEIYSVISASIAVADFATLKSWFLHAVKRQAG